MNALETKPEYVNLTDTAKLVRAALKAVFPTVKFSVTSERYSMGCHINVRWTDGPPSRSVAAITSTFEGSSFDGMTDSRSYHNTEFQGRLVRFAPHSVNCSRTITNEDAKLELARELIAYLFHAEPSAYHCQDKAQRIVWGQDYIAGESLLDTFERVVMS